MLEYIKYIILKLYAKIKNKKYKNKSLDEFLYLLEKFPPKKTYKTYIFASEVLLFYIKNIRKDFKYY